MSTPTALDVTIPWFVTQPGEEDQEREKTNLALIFDRYKDKSGKLPKEKGWMTENLYMYEGFWYQSMNSLSLETLKALQDSFQAHPSDIYLITLPKVGTTWIKALAFAIINRTLYKNKSLSTHPLQIYNPHHCVPFIETEVRRTNPNYVQGHAPRLFSTHIPYTALPQSILDGGCRLVYLSRNPKDVLVSLFHFANKLRDKSRVPLTFEEAFEMFSKGVMPYGPWWEHVNGYYNAHLQHPTTILFLTYEDIKKDTENNVKRLAEFLGFPFTKEEGQGAVEEIVRLCSFENLSKANEHGNFREHIPNSIFFREGKVGDSSNYLTSEMNQVLDQIAKEKFHGLDISFKKVLQDSKPYCC